MNALFENLDRICTRKPELGLPQPREGESFKDKAKRLLKVAKILQAAWQAHPLYEEYERLCGDMSYQGKVLTPMVRLEVHHPPGPRTGTEVSCSFVRLAEIGGEMEDIRRKLKGVSGWYFQIMPVDPDDPILARGRSAYMGDAHLRIPRYWDFPNKAGLNYMARKKFKEKFPELKPILAAALMAKRVSRSTGKSKGQAFFSEVSENPTWQVLLGKAGLAATDIWALANNQLRPEEVEKLGHQGTLF